MNVTRTPLTSEQVVRLRLVAGVLVPGSSPSPPATSLPDLDDLLLRAASALGTELPAAQRAVDALPAVIDWDGLRRWSIASPAEFELVSTLVAGAYFMSADVLSSIGYATQQRLRAPTGQIADELGEGLLDHVLARGPIFRAAP